MISFPNAKINLGLNITSKLPNGYHNIESCFYPIPWCDVLEIISSKEINFTSSGITIPGAYEENLCLHAYNLLNKDFNLPPIHIHLHKVIPIGAGLGGGSADASFLLKMLNEMFSLEIGIDQLETYASQLGSDCPFFIQNKPVIATGTGTEFSSIDIDLSGKYLIVIKPNIHISTAEAYSSIKPKASNTSIRTIIETRPIEQWMNTLKNDFEHSIFPRHPEIKEIKKILYQHGAIYSSMTGSGAAVYGVFEDPVNIHLHSDWISFSTIL